MIGASAKGLVVLQGIAAKFGEKDYESASPPPEKRSELLQSMKSPTGLVAFAHNILHFDAKK